MITLPYIDNRLMLRMTIARRSGRMGVMGLVTPPIISDRAERVKAWVTLQAAPR